MHLWGFLSCQRYGREWEIQLMDLQGSHWPNSSSFKGHSSCLHSRHRHFHLSKWMKWVGHHTLSYIIKQRILELCTFGGFWERLAQCLEPIRLEWYASKWIKFNWTQSWGAWPPRRWAQEENTGRGRCPKLVKTERICDTPQVILQLQVIWSWELCQFQLYISFCTY